MQYRTGQKDKLTEYLRTNAAKQFTIEEISAALSEDIGKSTVYRLMHRLVEDGRVRRFQIGQARAVYYQYLPGAACESHLHMKCVCCGRMLHLDCSVSSFLQKQIAATNRFELDDRLTMLYGRCEHCRNQSGKEPT